MKEKTQDANLWLREISKDQNLNQLDDIELTTMRGQRRWFPSRIIMPMVNYGTYNPETGKVRLGGVLPTDDIFTLMDYTWEEDTTSQAAKTWTVPAGYIWIVLNIGSSNGNRAVRTLVSLNDGTTNGNLLGDLDLAQIDAGSFSDCLAGHPSMVLNGEDAITTTQLEFVAADVVRHRIRYVQIEV